MKKISLFLLLICGLLSPVFADSSFSLEQFLRAYFAVVTESVDIPHTYSFIRLNYTNISQKNSLYPFLQKAIYLDIFPNAKMALPLSKHITQRQATTIIRQRFPSVATGDADKLISMDRLSSLLLTIKYQKPLLPSQVSSDPISQSDIYKDVLYRLKSSYYYQT